MPNINTGILILKDDKSNQYPKEIFYKIMDKINEKENYEKIEKERTASLLKIIELLIYKYEEDDEKKQQYTELKSEINDEKDLFYRIINDKEEKKWKEIYDNINIEKNYSIEEIISSFDKINNQKDANKYNEEILKAYFIKLWCFNFITFNYKKNDELMKLLLNQKKDKIKQAIISDKKNKNIPYNLNNDEIEKTLNNDYKIIFLEKGESLSKLTQQLNKNMEDKSEFQLLLQHIIKQILIGLYLLHHLSKEECLYHNDLKPDNILICFNEKYNNNETSFKDKYMNAIYKIVDLDLTRKIKYSEIEHDYLNRMYNNCIFPYDDPDKEEIYEVGEILFELITGKMHYNDDEKKDNYQYLEKNCKIDVSQKLCLSIIKFLHRCLQIERKYRISCDDALIHEFLEKKDFNDPLDFNKLPKDLVSKNKKIFYLPIYRPFLGLNDYEMKEYESLDVEF